MEQKDIINTAILEGITDKELETLYNRLEREKLRRKTRKELDRIIELDKTNEKEAREAFIEMANSDEEMPVILRDISEIKEVLKDIEDREDDYACDICDALEWVLGQRHGLDL